MNLFVRKKTCVRDAIRLCLISNLVNVVLIPDSGQSSTSEFFPTTYVVPKNSDL